MKFKIGDRIKYVRTRYHFVDIKLNDELDVVEGKVHDYFWIVPGKASYGSSLELFKDCFELVERKEVVTQTTAPIKSDGRSSSYYDVEIPEWFIEAILRRKEEGRAYVKTEELIEVLFKDNFDFGTAFKSLVRAKGITEGAGKAGNSLQYETNKIHYYTDKILEKGERNAN